MTTRIAVCRPQLPDADRLLPYLRRVDDARIYTNWGPLTAELEHRLCALLGLPASSVVSASSGTAALVGAILAGAGRATPGRPLAIVPAFTFVGTALAVELCGYRPYLVDVDPVTWLLDIERLAEHPRLAEVGLAVVVAAFGRPVAHAPCLAFRERTGIPVVIDGGASFEGILASPARCAGDLPTALSFHATKSFSTGEGGCVVTTDAKLSVRVTRALNFGFFGDRNTLSPSTNGKMSEYHAAVGLAELDAWPQKRRAFELVARAYRQRMAAAGLSAKFVCAPEVAGCYALFDAGSPSESQQVKESLTRADIEFRSWYGDGVLSQAHFQHVPHDALDSTARLAPAVIGLPMATDLSDAAIDRVVAAVTRAAHPNSPAR